MVPKHKHPCEWAISSPRPTLTPPGRQHQPPSGLLHLPIFPDVHLSHMVLPDPWSWIAFLTIPQLRRWLWSSNAYGLKINPFTQHWGFHIRVPARLHSPSHCRLHGLYTLGKFPFIFLTPFLCSCYYISVRPFLVLTLTAYILPSPVGCLHATPFQQLPDLNPRQNEGSCILPSLVHDTGMKCLFLSWCLEVYDTGLYSCRLYNTINLGEKTWGAWSIH